MNLKPAVLTEPPGKTALQALGTGMDSHWIHREQRPRGEFLAVWDQPCFSCLYSLTTEALNTATRASQPCDLPERLLVRVTFKASLALAAQPACNPQLPPGSSLSPGKGSLLAGGHPPLLCVRARRRGGDRQGPTLLAHPLLQTPDSISVLSVSTYLLLIPL